jgi:hypothetical protein
MYGEGFQLGLPKWEQMALRELVYSRARTRRVRRYWEQAQPLE